MRSFFDHALAVTAWAQAADFAGDVDRLALLAAQTLETDEAVAEPAAPHVAAERLGDPIGESEAGTRRGKPGFGRAEAAEKLDVGGKFNSEAGSEFLLCSGQATLAAQALAATFIATGTRRTSPQPAPQRKPRATTTSGPLRQSSNAAAPDVWNPSTGPR